MLTISEISPFKVHQRAYEAFQECNMYFEELVDIKKKQMYLGEADQGTMDLLGKSFNYGLQNFEN